MAHSSDTLLFSIPQSPDETFSARFARCTREPDSWENELYTAARSVANSTTKPLWLFFGGDIDSFVLARAFRKNGIFFSVLIPEYASGTAIYDIGYIKEWCKQRSIPTKIIPIDLAQFYSVQVPRYASDGYVSAHAQRYLHLLALEAVEALGGFAVLPYGSILLSRDQGAIGSASGDLSISLEAGHAMAQQWCSRNDRRHEPNFFRSSPELCLAYLRLPMVEFATQHPTVFNHPDNVVLFKRLVYQSVFYYYNAERRFVGFEMTRNIQQAAEVEIAHALGASIHAFRLQVPDMLEQLTRA